MTAGTPGSAGIATHKPLDIRIKVDREREKERQKNSIEISIAPKINAIDDSSFGSHGTQSLEWIFV